MWNEQCASCRAAWTNSAHVLCRTACTQTVLQMAAKTFGPLILRGLDVLWSLKGGGCNHVPWRAKSLEGFIPTREHSYWLTHPFSQHTDPHFNQMKTVCPPWHTTRSQSFSWRRSGHVILKISMERGKEDRLYFPSASGPLCPALPLAAALRSWWLLCSLRITVAGGTIESKRGNTPCPWDLKMSSTHTRIHTFSLRL